MTEYTPQLATHKKQPNYLAVFAILAVITVLEVTVFSGTPFVLVLLSVSKVALVAMYYMHLKFENLSLTAVFMFPLPFVLLIAVVVIIALNPPTLIGPDGVAQIGAVCSFW